MLALLLSGPAGAAETPDAISPDRAGAANDPATVGAGAIQIETGLSYGHERIGGQTSLKRFAVEAALRWGLTDRLEIDFEGEPLVRLWGAQDELGHGEFGLKVKYRFLDGREGSWLPTLGVQPFVKLPVAEEPLGSGKTDFGVLLMANFQLPVGLSLTANARLAAIGQSQPDGYLVQGALALGLSRDLSESVSVFTDLLYTTPAQRGGSDRVLVDFGMLWYPTPDVAFDASVQTVPVGQGVDWALRAGVSVRFGR